MCGLRWQGFPFTFSPLIEKLRYWIWLIKIDIFSLLSLFQFFPIFFKWLHLPNFLVSLVNLTTGESVRDTIKTGLFVNRPALLSPFDFIPTQIRSKTSLSFLFVFHGVENVLLTASIELHKKSALIFNISSLASRFIFKLEKHTSLDLTLARIIFKAC